MLRESVTFSASEATETLLAAREDIFRFCVFESASVEGANVEGAFLSCSFRDVEWYWGFFNCAVLVGCTFERCIFRGASFANCRFVECRFVECQFLADNLAAPCSAPDTLLYGCSATDCEGWNDLFPNRVP